MAAISTAEYGSDNKELESLLSTPQEKLRRVKEMSDKYKLPGETPAQTALRLLDKAEMNKQKALEAALGQIERAFGRGSIMKLVDASLQSHARSPVSLKFT